ncbi:helix-turn-helix domain-containing protein [Streptomyces caatingaensis]|uniref:DUF5753 domain-containing protein n=1 Tax=Streptomyces caatingaensis TaxID=1678637 RepID=A0A0K9X9R4_9ACTN|nr:helix-turn-helix transcriptional regulator [Streptomyces caatingaensis]KNB49392.1 hypothetical protein AC230_29490 [Streptomyces caatingaensis]
MAQGGLVGAQAQRTARRRRLGAALRAAREGAGVTTTEAANAIHCDNTKMSRIETGRHRVTRLELNALFDLYRINDPAVRKQLIALASEGSKRSWWRRHSAMISPKLSEVLVLESDAARIAAFHTQVVPGLLQTPDYARAIIGGLTSQYTEEEVEFYVELRMERKRILAGDDPPVQYLALIPEGVLHQRYGGAEVLAAQLRHLVAVNRPPHLTIQVIPFTQTAFTDTAGSFTFFSYPDQLDLDVVLVESLDGSLCLQEDDSVAQYTKAIDGLRASALSTQQSVELITSMADELERG